MAVNIMLIFCSALEGWSVPICSFLLGWDELKTKGAWDKIDSAGQMGIQTELGLQWVMLEWAEVAT